jgi:integrase
LGPAEVARAALGAGTVPQFLLGDLAEHVAGKAPDDLVFTSPKGAVLRVRGARRSWFDRAVETSGVPEGLHPHELRHTAASLAVSAGANVKAVSRMLGHAKASMTLDVYADLFDDDLEAVADRLDEIHARVGGMWAAGHCCRSWRAPYGALTCGFPGGDEGT